VTPRGGILNAGRWVATAIVLLLLAGCSSRHRLNAPYPTALPPDQKLEVWRAGRRTLLHHVTIDSAMILGVARPWRPRCDSCSVAIPVTQADSLVLVNHEVLAILGGTAVLFVVWILEHCWPYSACSD
jgi:hypothetical protein